MLILQQPANTDDLHLRPSPRGVCLCMCAWCWWVCDCWAVGADRWGNRGPSNPCLSACMCLCAVWGMGEIILFCVWGFMLVQVRVELSLRDADRVTDPFSMSCTFRWGLNLSPTVFALHRTNKWKKNQARAGIFLALFSFCYTEMHPSSVFPLGLSFNAWPSFCIK